MGGSFRKIGIHEITYQFLVSVILNIMHARHNYSQMLLCADPGR